MVALSEAVIFIRFDRTPPYQSRLDTSIFHYSVIGLNGSNLCNKNGCSILCEVDGQTLTSCPADSIVLNNLTVNRKHHFRLNVTTKDGKRNSSSYRWFIGRAESPTQLLLEAASAKLTTSKRITTGVLQKNMPIKFYADARIAAKASESQTVGRQRNVGAAGDALNKMASSIQVASPMKQREYGRPDGRKRIVPEAIGVPSQKENIYGGSHSQAFYFPLNSSEHKKDANEGHIY